MATQTKSAETMTALERAMRAAFGDERFESMTPDERLTAWREFTGEATKVVRKQARDYMKSEAVDDAWERVKLAIVHAVNVSNGKLANGRRYVSAGSIRFQVDGDSGVVRFADKPAQPLGLRRFKGTEKVPFWAQALAEKVKESESGDDDSGPESDSDSDETNES